MANIMVVDAAWLVSWAECRIGIESKIIPIPFIPFIYERPKMKKLARRASKNIFFLLQFWILFPIVRKITADNSAVYIH